MNTKLIFLYFILVVLLIDASLCENRKQEKKQKKLNKRIHQNSNYTIETCNITNNTNQNTFVLRTSRSKEELEEVIRKAHLTMLKHKHKNKKAKKQGLLCSPVAGTSMVIIKLLHCEIFQGNRQ